MTPPASRRARSIEITGIVASSYRVTLAAPARAGRARTRERLGSIVRVAGGGETGVGEASPLPGYAPDTLDDAVEAISRLGAETPGERIDLEAPIRPQAERIATRLPEGLPSARFAVETALLDLVGQVLGLPLRALLSPGEPARAVPVAALVELGDRAAAERALDAGFTALKVKLSGPEGAERDVESLRELRRMAGAGVELRADANRAFTADEAADVLARLEGIELSFVEEPVRAGELGALAPGALPIALDESTREPDFWLSIPAGRRLAAVVLKPAVLGGLSPCLAIAAEARNRGAAAIVSHTFGGPVERAACAELALALGGPVAVGLGAHPGLAPLLPARERYGRGPEIAPIDEPGIALKQREALP